MDNDFNELRALIGVYRTKAVRRYAAHAVADDKELVSLMDAKLDKARKDMDAKLDLLAEREINLTQALVCLLNVFITGDHYDTRNPYSRPQVKFGLKVLAEMYGVKNWLDAADDLPVTIPDKYR